MTLEILKLKEAFAIAIDKKVTIKLHNKITKLIEKRTTKADRISKKLSKLYDLKSMALQQIAKSLTN